MYRRSHFFAKKCTGGDIFLPRIVQGVTFFWMELSQKFGKCPRFPSRMATKMKVLCSLLDAKKKRFEIVFDKSDLKNVRDGSKKCMGAWHVYNERFFTKCFIVRGM